MSPPPRKQREAKVASDILDTRAIFDAVLLSGHEVRAYVKQHEQLLQEESEHAWDRECKDDSKEVEQEAALIVQRVRAFEQESIFGNLATENIPKKSTRDMGGQFLTNKERIEDQSRLYEIAKMVPKAALLHLHFNTELHPRMLLQKARSMKNMYVRSTRHLLTRKDLEKTEMVFAVRKEDPVESDVNIFSEKYPGPKWRQLKWEPRVWMRWEAFRLKFAQRFPKPDDLRISASKARVDLDAAETWLCSKMVLSEEEAYGITQTVNGQPRVWARFNQATRCFKGLMDYERAYRWYIGKAIDHLIEDKVMYAELRPMLLDKSIPTDDGLRLIDNAEQMRLIIKAVEEKQARLKKKGKLHKFPFGLKIIYCTPRSIPKDRMCDEMKHCLDLKIEFPNLICGFDLVGAEDRPNHIGFYKDELIAFREACNKRNLDIPFLFHAGETLRDTGGSSDPSNSNLFDAVALQSKRIGHGFALMKHPQLVERFRRSDSSPGICIELCTTSNELLHLCRNVKEHPFPSLLAAGIPCTINTDNPSLFGNSMSHEFYQVMVGTPTMSLYGWKQLARWSLDYSCLSAEDKVEGHRLFDKDWNTFCKRVVKEYNVEDIVMRKD
ncbi:Metallo-dependent hydrolase [Plenodomus tracheiphilus IPT5]|uniref:Metallo-dependent hydrolase n=1 Tax=Plenodomus tracheiphilus IPT5 TaxID=1408161 RepID=A0A6A7AQX6_9PLEO|nr:Metallo-dependent hydrolase [Plenodomus tracheiphilus IPT5]